MRLIIFQAMGVEKLCSQIRSLTSTLTSHKGKCQGFNSQTAKAYDLCSPIGYHKSSAH